MHGREGYTNAAGVLAHLDNLAHLDPRFFTTEFGLRPDFRCRQTGFRRVDSVESG